jgi:hypothetical protein
MQAAALFVSMIAHTHILSPSAAAIISEAVRDADAEAELHTLDNEVRRHTLRLESPSNSHSPTTVALHRNGAHANTCTRVVWASVVVVVQAGTDLSSIDLVSLQFNPRHRKKH